MTSYFDQPYDIMATTTDQLLCLISLYNVSPHEALVVPGIAITRFPWSNDTRWIVKGALRVSDKKERENNCAQFLEKLFQGGDTDVAGKKIYIAMLLNLP
jgi:hypothetical protein